MSYPLEMEVRQEIVKAAILMHARGLIAGQDGNISVRIGPDKIVCTPSGINKGFMTERDLVVVDLDGNKVRGQEGPSSEILMHLLAYRQRQDVGCVIHAHPPHCVACTLVGLSLSSLQLPEAAFILGAVPTAPYATPGTPEVPASIEPFIGRAEAILLERHGSLTVGKNVREAYNRLEALEHVAHVLFLARNLGDVAPLNEQESERLRAIVTARGLPWKYPDSNAPDPFLTDAVVKRVLDKLRGNK
jgi:L-fuculose-phosphate aldolase